MAAVGVLSNPSAAEHIPSDIENKCDSALEGNPDSLTIVTDPAAGSTVTAGEEIDVTLSWDPAWWSSISVILSCAYINGELIHDSVAWEKDPDAVNDGEFLNSFLVPATASVGDEVCTIGRVSGNPTRANPSDDTHKSALVCFEVTAATTTTSSTSTSTSSTSTSSTSTSSTSTSTTSSTSTSTTSTTSTTIPTTTTSTAPTTTTTAFVGGTTTIAPTTTTSTTEDLGPVVLPTEVINTSTTTAEGPTTTAAVAPTVVVEDTPTTARVLGTQLARTGAGSNTLLVLGGLVLVLGGMALTFGEPQVARRRR